MNPIHPASLVDSAFHSKAILKLLKLDIHRVLIEYLAQTTADAIAFAHGSSSRSRLSRSHKHDSFKEFVSNVVSRSEVPIGVLLVALVYINRSQPHLSIETEEWARERVFLGALILAAKYTNDSTLKNIHWAIVTGVFGKRDIGRIEREFLDVLDWELCITESDILEHYDSIMALYHAIPRRRTFVHSSSRVPKPARRSPIVQPELWSDTDCDSDSDSDDSSSRSTSPSITTPPTPSHQTSFIKSSKSFGEDPPLHLLEGAGQHNNVPITVSLVHQIAV
jgi:hypothetical protein